MAGHSQALTPGLHPTLYHNDHHWTGQSPVAELLQGTGAVATLAAGLLFLSLKRPLDETGKWALPPPAVALTALLAVFQLILRQGIAF